MAVAHVSGAAALVRAHFPGATHQQIIKRILDGVDPLPSLVGKTATGGRLNLFKALGGPVALPEISIAATDATAAETGTDPAAFTLTRTGATTAPLTVLYTVAGTATNGVDYGALVGTAIIPAGSATAILAVQPFDDAQFEGIETVVITVAPSSVYSVGASANASISIADNDSPPLPTVNVAVTDGNAAERDADTATFTVARTGTMTDALNVSFALSGSAGNGVDYPTIPAMVTIPAGASSAAVVVTPIDDMIVEGDETVLLTLVAKRGYELGSVRTASATIVDNDRPQEEAPPDTNVSIKTLSSYAVEFGRPRGEFKISRQGGSKAAALIVKLAINGTATPEKDYERLPETVTIPAGKKSVRVTVAPVRDRNRERAETVEVSVLAAAGYSPGGSAKATVYIVDDDWLWEFLKDLWRKEK